MRHRFSAFGQTLFSAPCNTFQRALKQFSPPAEFQLPRIKLPLSPYLSPCYPGSFSQSYTSKVFSSTSKAPKDTNVHEVSVVLTILVPVIPQCVKNAKTYFVITLFSVHYVFSLCQSRSEKPMKGGVLGGVFGYLYVTSLGNTPLCSNPLCIGLLATFGWVLTFSRKFSAQAALEPCSGAA